MYCEELYWVIHHFLSSFACLKPIVMSPEPLTMHCSCIQRPCRIFYTFWANWICNWEWTGFRECLKHLLYFSLKIIEDPVDIVTTCNNEDNLTIFYKRFRIISWNFLQMVTSTLCEWSLQYMKYGHEYIFHWPDYTKRQSWKIHTSTQTM